MGIENFPQVFFDQFDNSQGGNTPEGKPSSPDAQFARPELTEYEKTLRAIGVVGERLTERIDGIDYGTLSDEECAKARYYRYSIAVSLRGMSREEFLPLNPAHREDEMVYMDAGARQAALDYLQDAPDAHTAFIVGLKGMKAPDKIHQLFFAKGLWRNILQFIEEYNP